MKSIEHAITLFAQYAWGKPLIILLLGGGILLLFYSRFLPFRYIFHAIDILKGKYDSPDDTGDITHFQALSSALAGTIGMGNIAGVAIAIQAGGPGAIFWMWVSAIVGITTKFFTCSLAIMYRGRDSAGKIQGGPMYVVTEGLGQKYKILAIFFCLAGMFGVLPIFQANQLIQILKDMVFIPHNYPPDSLHFFNLTCGIAIAIVVAIVILGGIKRIGIITSKLVPIMVFLYLLAAIYILSVNYFAIPECIVLIFTDAFSGKAAAGGVLGTVIAQGIRRAAFSNEAGIGTEAMAHGAAKTDEPIREGLVAMLGPILDTLIVCTTTALMILVTSVWQKGDTNGVTLTSLAFEQSFPVIGPYFLLTCVICFSMSTMFSYAYYGTKCFGFLFGAKHQGIYNYIYVGLIVLSSVLTIDIVVSLIDGMYALMAIPTMVSTILLAPKVMDAAKIYFKSLHTGTQKKFVQEFKDL